MENIDKKINEISKNFWSKQIRYPNYDNIHKRRFHEMIYLLDKIKNIQPRSFLDIGCGTGSTVTLLRELSEIQLYFCYDISEGMLSTLDDNPDRGSCVVKNLIDFTNLKQDFKFPYADLAISFGVFQYLDEESVINILNAIDTTDLIVRNACYLPHQGRQDVVTYSQQLQSEYACHYRVFTEYIQLFTDNGWNLIDLKRAYPDEIESAFGTKQWFFHLRKA